MATMANARVRPAVTVGRSSFSLQQNWGEVTYRLGEVIAQNNDIFCKFRSKLAITHNIAIKWKDKYNYKCSGSRLSPQLVFVW